MRAKSEKAPDLYSRGRSRSRWRIVGKRKKWCALMRDGARAKGSHGGEFPTGSSKWGIVGNSGEFKNCGEERGITSR